MYAISNLMPLIRQILICDNCQRILENGTVVIADYQTQGRGQKGAVWHSDKGKNLICSILLSWMTLMQRINLC